MTDFERYIKKCDLSLKDDVVITYDNVQALGKFIALLAIKRVMHYHGERGYQLYNGLIRDILYKKGATPKYKVTFTCDEEMGTIVGETSQTVVEGNMSTAVVAVANEGYTFVCWSNGSTEATVVLTPEKDMELTAYFTPNSTGLPVMTIYTENEADIVSKDDYINCEISLLDTETGNSIGGAVAEIKGNVSHKGGGVFANTTTLWTASNNPWFKGLLAYDEFKALVGEELAANADTLKKSVADGLAYAKEHAAAYEKNFTVWNEILGNTSASDAAGAWSVPTYLRELETWAEHLAYIENYLEASLTHLINTYPAPAAE